MNRFIVTIFILFIMTASGCYYDDFVYKCCYCNSNKKVFYYIEDEIICSDCNKDNTENIKKEIKLPHRARRFLEQSS